MPFLIVMGSQKPVCVATKHQGEKSMDAFPTISVPAASERRLPDVRQTMTVWIEPDRPYIDRHTLEVDLANSSLVAVEHDD